MQSHAISCKAAATAQTKHKVCQLLPRRDAGLSQCMRVSPASCVHKRWDMQAALDVVLRCSCMLMLTLSLCPAGHKCDVQGFAMAPFNGGGGGLGLAWCATQLIPTPLSLPA